MRSSHDPYLMVKKAISSRCTETGEVKTTWTHSMLVAHTRARLGAETLAPGVESESVVGTGSCETCLRSRITGQLQQSRLRFDVEIVGLAKK